MSGSLSGSANGTIPKQAPNKTLRAANQGWCFLFLRKQHSSETIHSNGKQEGNEWDPLTSARSFQYPEKKRKRPQLLPWASFSLLKNV